MKKTIKKSTRKALKRRGGYASSAGIRPISPNRINDTISRTISRQASRSKTPAQLAAEYVAKMAANKIAVSVGEAMVRKVLDAPVKDPEGNKETSSIMRQSVTGRPSTASTVGRTFKVKYEAGDKPTASVRNAEKQNGSTRIKYSDTSVDIGDVAARSDFNLRYGFNRKDFYWFDSSSYWTFQDLFTLSGIATYTLEQERYQRCYWLTKNFGTKITLLNKNQFLKSKVKIHLLRQTDLSYSGLTAFNEFCHPTVATPANLGHIPVRYQLSDRTTGTYRNLVSTDPKLTTISKSAAIKTLFDKAVTYSLTLEPGESVEFDYKHHTGSGIRMDQLQYANVDTATFSSSAPAFYYPVIEACGPMVECIDSVDTDRSWIGTASGAVQVSFTKYAEIVQGSQDLNTYLDTTGYEHNHWAFKVYSDPAPSEASTTSKIFNVRYADILREGETPAIGKYIIPVATDLNVTQGGKVNLG